MTQNPKKMIIEMRLHVNTKAIPLKKGNERFDETKYIKRGLFIKRILRQGGSLMNKRIFRRGPFPKAHEDAKSIGLNIVLPMSRCPILTSPRNCVFNSTTLPSERCIS